MVGSFGNGDRQTSLTEDFVLVVNNIIVVQDSKDPDKSAHAQGLDTDAFHSVMEHVSERENLGIRGQYNDCVIFEGDEEVLEEAALYIGEQYGLSTAVTPHADEIEIEYTEGDRYIPKA